ncbi:MAG: hypothetical protein ABI346_07660 [Candidatus Baltobacteraceae bacterium]
MDKQVRTNAFWRLGVFRVVASACGLFFVLTLVAMLLYPGGSVAAPGAERYSFFLNFFSDLGQTHVGYGPLGASNLVSMVLFVAALVMAAAALVLFFIAFAGLVGSATSRWLARSAALFGVVAGVSFVGVALTPWNHYLLAHNAFVAWAFRAFFAADLLLFAAVVLEPGFPRRFAWIFGAFAALLAAYVGLLTFGPTTTTALGSIVQATGQKVIAYASILTVCIQSLNVVALPRSREAGATRAA